MCNYVTKNQVYDMDIVRKQFETTLRGYYQRGCLDGTDYPPEWRLPTKDFNIRSVPNYCKGMLDAQDYEINKEVLSVGRPRY